MKIEARIDLQPDTQGPDPWDEDWGISLPMAHIICRDVDGTPHNVGEYVWPLTAYTAHRTRLLLHFFFWKQNSLKVAASIEGITANREALIREMQFLMTRQIYFGDGGSPTSLYQKANVLHYIARFAELRSCSVRNVLTQTALLNAFCESLPNHALPLWMNWFALFRRLNPETQLGFTMAKSNRWKDWKLRVKNYCDNTSQVAPLPTRIYGTLINNLLSELNDIEEHKSRLLAALREAIVVHRNVKATAASRGIKNIGRSLIEKHGLVAFLERRGFNSRLVRSLGGAISEIFQVCKLLVHVFSGMRDSEARHLPFHCIIQKVGRHGRACCLIIGTTTKFNNGRRLRTKWVTTECEGLRAVKLAQDFASVIYEVLGVTPSRSDKLKDNCPLFPSTDYLPWMQRRVLRDGHISVLGTGLSQALSQNLLLSCLCPLIEEGDIAELEDIDPFRAWREEPDFAIGRRWPLTTHQLRRSLAVYANASGLVRLSSLRRQLQQMTRDMALYYTRGSTFCKDFIADDPHGYKKHVAVLWQDGAEEAAMLTFVRDVLNSAEPMFGGAGAFYERQNKRGDVMSREEVTKQIKAGLLAYRDGPLGGCTRPGKCETRKGLNLIDTVCATDGCKHLIGKHSKIVQTIRLKRAAMTHITSGSITESMEREELEALEFVERKWRPKEVCIEASVGGKYV